MSSKGLVMLGLLIGSTVGGYLPTLFGASAFSLWSVFGSAVGGALGVYFFYKISSY